MPAATSRYALPSVHLAPWPAGPACPRLDLPRRELDDTLDTFFTDGEAIQADKTLSQLGRRQRLEELWQQNAAPVLDDLTARLAGARVVLEKMAEKFAPRPAPNNAAGELRRGEIRTFLRTLSKSDRLLRVERAVNEEDTETLSAVAYAPAVYGADFLPAGTADRVRRVLMAEGAGPGGLVEWDRMNELIPVLALNIDEARAIFRRAVDLNPAEWVEIVRSRANFAKLTREQAERDAARRQAVDALHAKTTSDLQRKFIDERADANGPTGGSDE